MSAGYSLPANAGTHFLQAPQQLTIAARTATSLARQVIIALALAACATAPEQKLVTSVSSLPPVQVPLPTRCVETVPPIPDVKIDPNATPLQRYYMMKEAVLAYEGALIAQRAILLGCAGSKP